MNPSPSVPIGQYIRQEWQFAPEMNADTGSIAEIIFKSANPGLWLDLGCGPLLSIWPLFSEHPTDVFGLDRNSDILQYHQQLLNLGPEELPSDIQDAYKAAHTFRLRRRLTHISDPRSLVRGIRVQDVLNPVESWASKFDTVIQIGCFGCLGSLEDFQLALTLVRQYLKPGGVFISATWTPKPSYSESAVWGGDSLRQLEASTVGDALRSSGWESVAVDCAQTDDSRYTGRFVIQARRPFE